MKLALSSLCSSTTPTTRRSHAISKSYAVDARKNINRKWFAAKSYKFPGIREVIYCNVCQRRAEANQRRMGRFCIRRVCLDEKVEVLSGRGLSMKGNRVSTHD